jgi:hypothetical protein
MKTTIYSWFKWFNVAGHFGKAEIPGNRPVIEDKANKV